MWSNINLPLNGSVFPNRLTCHLQRPKCVRLVYTYVCKGSGECDYKDIAYLKDADPKSDEKDESISFHHYYCQIHNELITPFSVRP